MQIYELKVELQVKSIRVYQEYVKKTLLTKELPNDRMEIVPHRVTTS